MQRLDRMMREKIDGRIDSQCQPRSVTLKATRMYDGTCIYAAFLGSFGDIAWETGEVAVNSQIFWSCNVSIYSDAIFTHVDRS